MKSKRKADILEGVYGEEKKKWAEERGLDHIVYFKWEKGNRVYRYDLITEKTILEPKALDYHKIEKLQSLRNFKKHGGRFTQEMDSELNDLEFAAMINHQVI